MKTEQLREEIAIELHAIELTITELMALRYDVADGEPRVRDTTAAAAFLAQFYNGIENILKRICVYHAVPLPAGETWHVELFQLFCEPADAPLPSLFDESLAVDLAAFRRFRHVVFHSYGYQLDWTRMTEGIADVESVFSRFSDRLSDYLRSLPSQG